MTILRTLSKLAFSPSWLLLSLVLPLAANAQLPAGTTDASSPTQTQQDPLRAQANEALEKRDYPAAQKLLTSLVEKNPTDAHLLYDLASTQDALDQPAAAETYRRAIAADPKLFEPHLALGLLLARQGESSAAHTELATAVTLDAPAPALKARAYRALARLDQSASQPAAASADLLAALKISPETPEDISFTAELAEASGDLPAAEAAYRRLLAASPNDPAATAALTHLLLRQNKPAEAESLLTAALAIAPEDTTLNAQLATVYMASDDPAKSSQALPLVEKLHASHPNDPAVTRILARLYSRSAQYDKADPLFATLIAATPPGAQPDPTLLDDRADALIHLHRAAEAEALLKRAVANSTGFPSKEDLGIAASHLAFAASENNDPQVTLQALSLRATVLPQSPSALFLEATARDKLHEVKKASELYNQFLSVANGKFPDEEWEARHRLITLNHQK
ncbi:tetratricopeptide repeat protein [Granulicella sp. dw_53]|uniref:tetratricopeptide repeat protein n=1 Tax=Granulicella sp. dw_53 TaxID=2719792 RepID=UPI001BD63F00|nr:tetratricopeptide repeat protein [Granulicella sp. dw_53]